MLTSEKLRVGVTGATGMAGAMVTHYFKSKGHKVMSFSRNPIEGFRDRPLNILHETDMDNLYFWMAAEKPHAVINCIGRLVQESNRHPSKAIYVNSYFPHKLEDIGRATGTKIIHLSTDCIFDGITEFSYVEDDLPDETNWYGRSKALGELNNDKDLTLRQSIIGPAIQTSNTGLFNWIYNQKDTIVKGYDRVMWNGITTLELAKNIERILLDYPKLSGIYHLVPANDEYISKYELLKLIRDIWQIPATIEKEVITDSSKILYNSRFNDYPVEIPGYIKQLTELYDFMEKTSFPINKF